MILLRKSSLRFQQENHDETFEAMKETELLKNCSNRRNVYTDVDKMIRDILEESIGENDEK